MSLNDDILDAITAHAVGVQRLSNGEVRKIVALLKRVETDVTARLITAGTELSRQRLEDLLAEVQRIVASVHADATGQLRIDLNGLAEYEIDYQDAMFKELVPVRLETVKPAPFQVISAVNARPFQGKLLNEWFTELESSTFRTLRDAIRLGYTEGRTTDQMVRTLRGTKAQGYKDGVLETTRRQAEAVVRTAVAHTVNHSREIYYGENPDLIKGVQWVSTLDSRTTLICMARDGIVYPVKKGPRPPAHVNCRSTTTPVTKSWREIGIDIDDAPPGTRASMDGQVAADQTYSEWLRKKPAAFQDDVLGVAKGKLFRDGGLSLDRFVNRAGDELTLDQLRTQESAAWTKVFAN